MYTARSQERSRTYTRYRYGVPDQPKTPHRTFRADDDLWADACAAAELLDMEISTGIRDYLTWLARRTRAGLKRPAERPTREQVEDWKRRHPSRKRKPAAEPPATDQP